MDNKTVEQREELARNWVSSQKSISMFISAAVGNTADAEDILQEVACQVAIKYDQYDSSRPFLPWAIGVAKNKIADYYREQKRESPTLMGDFMEYMSEVCFRIHTQLHPYSIALEKCVQELSAKNRQLLSLRYGGNIKPKDIADHLNTSSKTVHTMLTRIRSSLKKCIQLKVDQHEE